jgi:beta-lactamase superfamily II metal-dependent hydrolase
LGPVSICREPQKGRTGKQSQGGMPSNLDANSPVALHVFGCGHGDTILVRLPHDRTVLIDCCLSKSNGVLPRFLRYLDDLGVTRLDYVFQTHPDVDHFLGMADVLKHFSNSGRSIGTWCDGGVNSQRVRALLLNV